MSGKTRAANRSSPDEISQDIPLQPRSDADQLSPEDGKKSRGFLHVPSRSSSQRNQTSPTSTGLSGATASDSRNSIGGHSKESKGSVLGRQRNGSASSQRSAAMETEPTNTPGNSQPASPVAPPQRKKKSGGGLLTLLACCGVPDHANALDGGDENVHKLDRLPARPTTAKSRQHTPQDQPSASRAHLHEKEQPPVQPPMTLENKGKRVSGASTQDQSTVGGADNESKQTTLVNAGTPAVRVEGPNGGTSDSTPVDPPERDDEGDIAMPDSVDVGAAQKQSVITQVPEEPPTRSLPPPPAGPPPTGPSQPMVPIVEAGPVVPEERVLLPPIAPEHKGRKCLVLDLDETLVHSSFKVSCSFCSV